MNERERRNQRIREARASGHGVPSESPATELWLLMDAVARGGMNPAEQDNAWRRIRELESQVAAREAEAEAAKPTAQTELTTAEKFAIAMELQAPAADPLIEALVTQGTGEVPRDETTDNEEAFAEYITAQQQGQWSGEMQEWFAQANAEQVEVAAHKAKLREEYILAEFPDSAEARSLRAKKGHETRRRQTAEAEARAAAQRQRWVDERMARWDAEHPSPPAA